MPLGRRESTGGISSSFRRDARNQVSVGRRTLGAMARWHAVPQVGARNPLPVGSGRKAVTGIMPGNSVPFTGQAEIFAATGECRTDSVPLEG